MTHFDDTPSKSEKQIKWTTAIQYGKTYDFIVGSFFTAYTLRPKCDSCSFKEWTMMV